jgi:tRNA 2-thiouridine synthesizing protein A
VPNGYGGAGGSYHKGFTTEAPRRRETIKNTIDFSFSPVRFSVIRRLCHENLAVFPPSIGGWVPYFDSLAQISADAHVAGMSETLLDVKGMNCPLPVLKANRTLRGMAAGERLRVLATDRAAVADFQAFCRETGHALLAWSEESGVFSFVIRRRGDDPEKKGS